MLLSLDLSTHSSGWAIFDEDKLIKSGCITSSSTDLIKRIHVMTDGIAEILNSYPDIKLIVAEEVRPDIGNSNLKTHRALMFLQAALEFLIHDNYKKIEIEYIYPSSWRSKCGIRTGRGIKRTTLKEADIAFVKEKFGLSVNDDEADAISIGFAHNQKEEKKDLNWG